MQFPIFKTKIKGLTRVFDLSDPKQRQEYFQLKAVPEINKLRKYLRQNSFIAYLLGKKNSGKGTYTKLFMEAVDATRIAHISVGDVVRDVHRSFSIPAKKKELIDYLQQNYRGYVSIEAVLKDLLNRDTKTLLPTELILALVKREIDQMEKKTLFIDGFPRNLDQVSYSLYFRDLIDYRQDRDLFVLIDVPKAVIDERLKHRVVCPKCYVPRNLKLFPTPNIGYEEQKKEFYLKCDNPKCNGARMISKEGDKLGIEAISERLEVDEKLIKQAFSLHGIPKILLRNSVPKDKAAEYVDDYEITPKYSYRWHPESRKVEVIEEPWVFKDDQGIPSYSLLAPPVVISMIKQIADVLNI